MPQTVTSGFTEQKPALTCCSLGCAFLMPQSIISVLHVFRENDGEVTQG